ncbi:MAG: tetratricopeptide repeat protein [Candidatus Acidiferrales bacterium]
MKIPDSLVVQLRRDLVFRRIGDGMKKLHAHREIFNSLRPVQTNAAALLGCLAQWVDIGFASPTLIKKLLLRFPKTLRATMPLSDYVHLRMAEGFVAMTDEEFGKAIEHFEIAISLEDEIRNKEMVAIASFSIGRCHRRVGRYQDALNYVAQGKKLALHLKYPKMSAVMQVLEAWIAFQDEKPDEALRLLSEAEAVLSETDDYVTRGNINSALGRIARRQGKYHQALHHFDKAIEDYKKLHPQHRNVARSLVNMASVKRLIALQFRIRIDNEAARRRKNSKPKLALVAPRKTRDRGSFENLHQQALSHLAAAAHIYARYDDHRGAGAVHFNSGYIYLDEGDLDRAASEAATAYRLGEEKKDRILQARARILQSAVDSARFDEQLEGGLNSDHPAQSASDYAREAVEFAKQTQSRRLLAKAYLALGSTLSNDFFDDLDAAHECCDKTAALLASENQDYVWRELQTLKRKLLRSGKIDSILREWSQGSVGNKSFQQISEEFAEILIPKIWKREGRRISRVAERLSISPKKIRRILRNTGLLQGAKVSRS